MHHSFDLAHASKYGLKEAILIHHFQHWIRVNRTLKQNQKEGRTWTYQTMLWIAAHFPYLGDRWAIRGIINSLIDQGVLRKGCYNKQVRDRTTWYAFEDESVFVPDDSKNNAQSENSHLAKCEISPPLPDHKSQIIKPKKNNNNARSPAAPVVVSFAKWEGAGIKIGKAIRTRLEALGQQIADETLRRYLLASKSRQGALKPAALLNWIVGHWDAWDEPEVAIDKEAETNKLVESNREYATSAQMRNSGLEIIADSHSVRVMKCGKMIGMPLSLAEPEFKILLSYLIAACNGKASREMISALNEHFLS